MYKSPIEIIYGQMQTNMEDNIYEAIQKYNVNVDKDELIKALQYDRNQYEVGYQDGIKALAERLTELYTDDIITDDMHCAVGVIKANITDIAKEMLGGRR